MSETTKALRADARDSNRDVVPADDTPSEHESLVAPRAPAAKVPTRRRSRPIVSLLRNLVRQPAALLGLIWIGLLLIATVYVTLISAVDPNAQDLRARLEGPSWEHPLGLDNLGRDTFTRMLDATPVALMAVLQGVALACLIGIVPGLIAGFRRGAIDNILTKIADVFIVLPGIVIALAILGALGPGLSNAMIAIGVLFAPAMFRVVRSAVLGVREEGYVDAARVMGLSNRTMIVRHVLPNVLSPLLVQVALTASLVLLAEASLSYLGLGVQPPNASWGSIIRDGQRYMNQQPLLGVFPGLAITISAVAFNFIAEGFSKAVQGRGGPRPEGQA